MTDFQFGLFDQYTLTPDASVLLSFGETHGSGLQLPCLLHTLIALSQKSLFVALQVLSKVHCIYLDATTLS